MATESVRVHLPENSFRTLPGRVTRTQPNRKWKSSESNPDLPCIIETHIFHAQQDQEPVVLETFIQRLNLVRPVSVAICILKVQNDPSAGQCRFETPRHTKQNWVVVEANSHRIASKGLFFNFLRQGRICLPNFLRGNM